MECGKRMEFELQLSLLNGHANRSSLSWCFHLRLTSQSAEKWTVSQYLRSGSSCIWNRGDLSLCNIMMLWWASPTLYCLIVKKKQKTLDEPVNLCLLLCNTGRVTGLCGRAGVETLETSPPTRNRKGQQGMAAKKAEGIRICSCWCFT